MNILGGSCCLFLMLNVIVPARTGANTQASSATSQLHSVEGVDLYRLHCATCHGKDGKGNGPVAFAMRVKVPDLTVLAKMNGGTFPAARMRKIILCEVVNESHGSREMPVWGPIFIKVEPGMDRRAVRVENLVKYLESIQVKGKT